MRACALKSSFEGKKDFLMSRVSRSCRDFPDSSRSIRREKGQQDRRVGKRKKWTKSQHKIRRRKAVRESSLQQTHDPICPSNLTREAVMSTNGALNIVLVHGGFVDGSGWEGVYNILKRDGTSRQRRPAPDLVPCRRRRGREAGARVAQRWRASGRPLVRRGRHHRSRQRSDVVGLVYIAAFAPSDGESVNTLIANPPPGAPVPPILPPVDGYLFLDKTKFRRRSPATWTRPRPRSWPTRRCRGASRHSAARSAKPRGRPSRAGTW